MIRIDAYYITNINWVSELLIFYNLKYSWSSFYKIIKKGKNILKAAVSEKVLLEAINIFTVSACFQMNPEKKKFFLMLNQ